MNNDDNIREVTTDNIGDLVDWIINNNGHVETALAGGRHTELHITLSTGIGLVRVRPGDKISFAPGAPVEWATYLTPELGEVFQDSEGTLYTFVGVSPRHRTNKWAAFGCGDYIYEEDMKPEWWPRKRVFDVYGNFVGVGALDYPNGIAFREKQG